MTYDELGFPHSFAPIGEYAYQCLKYIEKICEKVPVFVKYGLVVPC